MNNSKINTTTQQIQATVSNCPFNKEAITPTAKAQRPASGMPVTSMMAGKVITLKVMYGT